MLHLDLFGDAPDEVTRVLRPATAGLFSLGRVYRQLPVSRLGGPRRRQALQSDLKVGHDVFEHHGTAHTSALGKLLEPLFGLTLYLPPQRNGVVESAARAPADARHGAS